MIQVNGLSKTYGSRVLFENVSFSLASKERVGLVGRNGSGKSTIFRLLLGHETPDSGDVVVPRSYRIGHLAQHLDFKEPNIVKEASLGLAHEERTQEYRAETILSGLGFSNADFAKPPSEFSGGYQIRLNLAKLLLSEPDLLLLDEPTNYLDIVSMRWLSNFLYSWNGELIIISHDRSFMDSITTHTMLIHRQGVRKISGGSAKLYEQVRVDEEVYEKTRVNEDKKRKELETFINRFRAKASKAASVQSKIKALEKMQEKEALINIEDLDFEFCEANFPGKKMLEVKDLDFAYPNSQILIEQLNLGIQKGDRICLVGKNGRGKSTFLRLLAGELVPSSGEIVVSPNSSIGYFGQSNIRRLEANLTIEDEIQSANPVLSKTRVRAICGTMMFSGDDALKKISVLSGGEQSRVVLGKLLALPTNVLLLDEPTNHLDQESVEALVSSLETYKGAVVMVTHNESLLSRVADKLVVFKEPAPYVFNHGYDYFIQKGGWDEQREVSGPTKRESVQIITHDKPRQIGRGSAKDQKKLAREIDKLDREIAQGEALVTSKQLELSRLVRDGNGEAIAALSEEISALEEQIRNTYQKWEVLAEKLE